MRKKIDPTFNGTTLKRQCLVLCFAQEGNNFTQIPFESQLKTSVFNAIISEKDPYKIQTLIENRNLGAYFWSDYFFSPGRKINRKLKETYLDINNNGLSFNEANVRILTLYIYFNSFYLPNFSY